MIKTKSSRRMIWHATRRWLALIPLLAIGGCIENSALNGAFTDVGSMIAVGGSVGDGPIVGSTITVRDANGQLVLSGTGTDRANYALKLPNSTQYPITVATNGGTDLVTGIAPTFQMRATISERSNKVININPYSTLITSTAEAMPGGISPANIALANRIIMNQFDFGIDTQQIPNIITTPVTPDNVATVVKASEALAEMIRRTSAAAQAAGTMYSDDDVIRILAADLVDGVVDGLGASAADPLIAVLASISSAQVLIETLSNNLYVNGVWATQLMDNAIRIVHPNIFARTADAPLTSGMLDHLSTIMTAIQDNASQFSVQDIIDALPQISATNSPSEAALILSPDRSGILSDVAQYLASGTTAGVSAFNTVIRTATAARPAIVVLQTATPNINAGDDVVLIWATAYGQDCTASGDWTGTKAAFGTQVIKNISVGSTFNMSCANAVGDVVTGTVHVTVNKGSSPVQQNSGTTASNIPLIENVIRINAGGDSYIDSNGNLWEADRGYNAGNVGQWSSQSISNSNDAYLYQTERWISPSTPYLEYNIDVPNGQYRVTLHLVDHVFSTAGKRVARVAVEGTTKIASLDVADEVGIHSALEKQIAVTVADGQLNIRFERIVENPNVAAIEIEKIDPSAINDRDLTLVWNAVSEPVTGYVIYTAPTPNGEYSKHDVMNIDSYSIVTGITSYTFRAWEDLALIQGDAACFKMKAFNAAGLSNWSEAACVNI